jgi:ClpP class serine protease
MVGSVGVIMMHVDQSTADAKKGMVYTPIYAGARKADFSSHAPLSDAARAQEQSEVDRIYEMFVQSVATGRKIDAQVVRDTEAGLLSPEEAMSAGMIDGIQSFGDSVSEFETAAAKPRTLFHLAATDAASSDNERHSIMAEKQNGAAASETAANATDVANAEARGRAAGVTEGAKQGADAAKARIKAITESPEAEGRSTLAKHLAFETDLDAEAAVAILKNSAKEGAPKPDANPLDDKMRRLKNPTVGTQSEAADNVRRLTSGEIFANRRKQAGHAA